MQNQLETELLERYAQASNHKVLSSQADLDAKDRAMPEMLSWCRQQGNIVALNDGSILSSNPSARTVQNCKIVMINKGLRPGRVLAATSQLINMLLANAVEAEEVEQAQAAESVQTVTTQQQRLRMLVKEAVDAGASDIHIEVRPDIAKIRFRKNGELYLHAEWLPNLGREIASVAFNKETDHAVTHFNPLVPQNASMPLSLGDHEVRLRLASMPAHGGFDVVMRVLATEEDRTMSLEELGYTKRQIALIKKAVNMPSGTVIISGPTGSGKTTTMAAALLEVELDRKIYTIEDPVEKVVPTATQVPVNSDKTDRTFASMGKAALRMDPDVMVLGEMRDDKTANVMVRASITGHLVFSTLHTNSAPAIVTRLVDMGISANLLGDPNLLTCLISQRLLPKLCPHCSIPVMQSGRHQAHLGRWQSMLGDISNIQVRGGAKCTHCRNIGVNGRTVVAEIVWIDELGRRYIQQGDTLGWEKYLKQQGWATFRDHAMALVTQGVVDPLDAEKIVGPISAEMHAEQFDYRAVA